LHSSHVPRITARHDQAKPRTGLQQSSRKILLADSSHRPVQHRHCELAGRFLKCVPGGLPGARSNHRETHATEIIADHFEQRGLIVHNQDQIRSALHGSYAILSKCKTREHPFQSGSASSSPAEPSTRSITRSPASCSSSTPTLSICCTS